MLEAEKQLRELIAMMEEDHRRMMKPLYAKLVELASCRPPVPVRLTQEQYDAIQNAISGDHK